jgi:hypothetical protein
MEGILVNSLVSSKRGIIRRGIGLGGGLLLLVGLILNVQAESVSVHTYRPVFIKETGTYSYSNLYPPSSTKAGLSLEYPAAWPFLEDKGGGFCKRCHERGFALPPGPSGPNAFLDNWQSSRDPFQ